MPDGEAQHSSHLTESDADEGCSDLEECEVKVEVDEEAAPQVAVQNNQQLNSAGKSHQLESQGQGQDQCHGYQTQGHDVIPQGPLARHPQYQSDQYWQDCHRLSEEQRLFEFQRQQQQQQQQQFWQSGHDRLGYTSAPTPQHYWHQANNHPFPPPIPLSSTPLQPNGWNPSTLPPWPVASNPLQPRRSVEIAAAGNKKQVNDGKKLSKAKPTKDIHTYSPKAKAAFMGRKSPTVVVSSDHRKGENQPSDNEETEGSTRAQWSQIETSILLATLLKARRAGNNMGSRFNTPVYVAVAKAVAKKVPRPMPRTAMSVKNRFTYLTTCYKEVKRLREAGASWNKETSRVIGSRSFWERVSPTLLKWRLLSFIWYKDLEVLVGDKPDTCGVYGPSPGVESSEDDLDDPDSEGSDGETDSSVDTCDEEPTGMEEVGNSVIKEAAAMQVDSSSDEHRLQWMSNLIMTTEDPHWPVEERIRLAVWLESPVGLQVARAIFRLKGPALSKSLDMARKRIKANPALGVI